MILNENDKDNCTNDCVYCINLKMENNQFKGECSNKASLKYGQTVGHKDKCNKIKTEYND